MDLRAHLDGDSVVIESADDVGDVLAHNAFLRGEEQRSDWGRHVASIPNVILIKWLNEEHARGNTSLKPFTTEFDAIVQKKLADPEWFYLRTDRPALLKGWEH